MGAVKPPSRPTFQRLRHCRDGSAVPPLVAKGRSPDELRAPSPGLMVVWFRFQGLDSEYEEEGELLGQFVYDQEGESLQMFLAPVSLRPPPRPPALRVGLCQRQLSAGVCPQ